MRQPGTVRFDPVVDHLALGDDSSFTERANTNPRQGDPDLIIESLTHSLQNPASEDTITFAAVVKIIGSSPPGPPVPSGPLLDQRKASSETTAVVTLTLDQ